MKDTNKLLEKGSELAHSLKASQPYGLLGKTVVTFKADLSDKVASTSLNHLEKLGMIEEVQTAKIERRGRPEKVYRVTRDGVDWLKENGFENATLLAATDPIALAHRYCQALVGVQSAHNNHVEIERTIPLQDGRSLRMDLVVPLTGGTFQFLEIEQSLDRRNLVRAVEKFKALGELFRDADYRQRFHTHVIFVFNLTPTDLQKTLALWQEALSMAFPNDEPLPFSPHYTTLGSFISNPSLGDGTHCPILEKRKGMTVQEHRTVDGKFPDYRLAPSTMKLLDRMKSSFPRKPLNLPAQDPDQLLGLCEIAMTIYCRSMYVNSPTLKYAAFPHESVQTLRDFLRLPENILLFESLKEGMTWLEGRRSGLMVYRDAATRLVRDVFLRHFGFGIGDALHVYVNVPDPAERFSEIRIEAHLSRDFEPLKRQGMVARTDEYEKAISWMLTALFTYPVDLGFSEDLWSFPKRKGGKRGSAQ